MILFPRFFLNWSRLRPVIVETPDLIKYRHSDELYSQEHITKLSIQIHFGFEKNKQTNKQTNKAKQKTKQKQKTKNKKQTNKQKTPFNYKSIMLITSNVL